MEWIIPRLVNLSHYVRSSGQCHDGSTTELGMYCASGGSASTCGTGYSADTPGCCYAGSSADAICSTGTSANSCSSGGNTGG